MLGPIGTLSATLEDMRFERALEKPSPAFSADSEPATAWKIFVFNARLLASAAGVLVALLMTTGFYIEPLAFLVALVIAIIYWRFGVQNARSAERWDPRVSCSLAAIAQIILLISILTPLTYLATSIGLPLWDTSLLIYDRALGFDFLNYLDFINHHPQLMQILSPAYNSITWQLFAIGIVVPVAGCYRRTGEAICAFMIALLATTCISAFVPAIGVYGTLGLSASDFPYFEPNGYYDTLRDAPLLRDGQLRALNLLRLVGVLTFPSFHAASATLYMWAFWPLSWLRPIIIPLNIIMIAATPLGGGHYLVDVIAGIIVAVLAILATQVISGRLTPEYASAQAAGEYR
jgi:hypothetical protein